MQEFRQLAREENPNLQMIFPMTEVVSLMLEGVGHLMREAGLAFGCCSCRSPERCRTSSSITRFISDFDFERERIFQIQRLSCDATLQGYPIQKFHNDERLAVLLPDLMGSCRCLDDSVQNQPGPHGESVPELVGL